MTKTLTIELSEDLSERLSDLATTSNASLEELILQTIQLLATSVESLQDQSPHVRANAVRRLAFIGTETVVSALERTLEDHDGEVRQAAAEALRQIGTKSGLALLNQKLPESSGLFYDAAEPVPPLSSLIGTLHLETTDLAENHDRYLAESLEREMQSGE